jgi:signal transduction histidine kinase
MAFNKSLDLAQKKQFKDLIQKNNAALAELYKQLKDFSKAFSCLERASAYSDSLFNEANTRHITEAQFKYNTAQGEKQIQALQLRQSRFWFVLALAIFLLVTAWLIYFLRAKAMNNKILLQKNSEIQLQNRRLQESNEILHQFAYASAHDLKEPLRSIGSFTSIIAKRYTPLLPPEAGEYMSFITGGVKRMENLLSGLLEYSTIISEEHTVTKAFNLTRVLDDVVKNLHSKILERDAVVEFNNCDMSLFVSRLHLLQLFQNLVGNALKFSSDTPKVSINCVYKKDVVLLSVKDNGIGIKQEHGDKIFKLFQRLSRAPQYEGTGIGLTICKNIVEKHNGKIWFESQEGQGTTFFIELPIALVKQNTPNTEGVASAKKETLQLA